MVDGNLPGVSDAVLDPVFFPGYEDDLLQPPLQGKIISTEPSRVAPTVFMC